MLLTRKHQPSPTVAIKIPAMDGPTNLAAFTIEEFRAIAFPTSSVWPSIISFRKA